MVNKRFWLGFAVIAAIALFSTVSCEESDNGGGTSTFTVTFNLNGGSGTAPSQQKVQKDSSITLPGGSGLSRSSYTFGGWNTNASGTGTNYSAGSSYTVTGDITLYAKWNATQTVTYTVTFNANGGSGTSPSAQTVSSGSSITLPSGSGLSKTGYAFGGWNTNASGTGTNYSAGSSYTVTGSVTLYARWVASVTNYTVTFNANGGNGTAPSAQTASSGSNITLPSGSGLTKTGYTFGGWNTSADGTGTNYSADSSYTVTGNITLYARWQSGSTPPISLIPNPPANLTATSGLLGITLLSWDAVSGATSYRVYNSGSLNGTYTLIPETVGKTNTTYQSSTTIEYFYKVTAVNSHGESEMSAAVRRGYYIVTFNSNGGSGTVSAQAANSGSSIILPSGSGLTRTGYIFGGWSTNSSGTGTSYTANSSYTVTGNVTLYARWVEYFTFNSATETITRYNGPGGAVEIPSAINGVPVTSIGEDAFYNCQLTSVVIPDSVTSIESRAFGANRLTSVVIPDSVTSIGSMAFGANRLTGVKIGNSVTTIGDNAFRQNQLTIVVIPDSVITIGGGAFYDNYLISVTIGNAVTTIGGGAFYNNQLTGIIIPDSVTTIGEIAFASNQLDSVTIGANVSLNSDSFGNNGFETAYNNNYNLAGTYGKYTILIGNTNRTVWGRIRMSEGFIYSGTTEIIIIGCEGLYGTIEIPATIENLPVTAIASAEYDQNGVFYNRFLTSVTIPDTVTSIGSYAFDSNHQLRYITIPNSVTTIGDGAFNTSPISITIGANVTLMSSSFGNIGFETAYNNNGKQAGTYTLTNGAWVRP